MFSEKVIAHANCLKDDLIDLGIKNEKIVVIPQGVKTKVPKFNKKWAKKSLGISGPLYLAIGIINPMKGFETILKYAKEIGKTIVIAGRAPDKVYKIYLKTLLDYVKTNKLEQFVKFYTDEDFKSRSWWLYFSAADIVLLPYKTMSSSGIFINAIESRKPVVCCDSRYFREIAQNYCCVKTVKEESDYPKAIQEAMHNLKKMEACTEQFYKDNNLNVIGKLYKELYASIR